MGGPRHADLDASFCSSLPVEALWVNLHAVSLDVASIIFFLISQWDIDPTIKMVIKTSFIIILWDLFGSVKKLVFFIFMGYLAVKVNNGLRAARPYHLYTQEEIQEVLALHGQGLSQNEIAQLLDIPKASVGNFLRRHK